MATFLKNINMVSRSATMYSDGEISKISPLKGYHAKYILTLCANPGVSQDQLAKTLFLNKSNVARQLTVLEELGYIERHPDPYDRRVSLVFPTDKADEILPAIRSINARWREVITEGFTEGEKEELLRLTQRLYENAMKYMEGKSDNLP